MAKRFEGKVALVTGGTSGLGADAARAFAAEGARVVLAGRREQAGAAIVGEIERAGGEGAFIRADVTQAKECRAMVEACVSRYGGLDFAINNAGVDGPHSVPVAEYREADWNRILATNLTGVFLSMKYEIPAMLARGGGSIVNMSAVAGFRGSARVGAAYVAAKHGLHGLTKTAALEYAGKGIRVNAVCPALIETPMSAAGFLATEAGRQRANAMHPIGRPGRPEEVTALALWLCSQEAGFVTGAAIPVDGGFLL